MRQVLIVILFIFKAPILSHCGYLPSDNSTVTIAGDSETIPSSPQNDQISGFCPSPTHVAAAGAALSLCKDFELTKACIANAAAPIVKTGTAMIRTCQGFFRRADNHNPYSEQKSLLNQYDDLLAQLKQGYEIGYASGEEPDQSSWNTR